MDEIAFDPNDLLRQFDTVSRSQRALVAEFERQQSRLIQLLRWYDHQKIARILALRRQVEQVHKEIRKQANGRSKVVLKERARLQHLLDDDQSDTETHISSTIRQKSPFYTDDDMDDRKRKVYGCLLPRLKASLSKSSDNGSQVKSPSILSQSDIYKKHIEKQRLSTNKFIESPIEQRNRMNKIINKCLYEFEQCAGNGYDHFLLTSEPNRNAQVLAQQIINEKDKYKYR